MNFFPIIFGIFFPGSSMSEIWVKFFFFFFCFSAYLISIWLKIMPEWGFLIFKFFYNRFRNFLPRVEYERNSGLKFFSLFLGICHPVLAINNAGKRIFNFLIFYSLFFLGIFLLGPSVYRIRESNFFISFSAYLIPLLVKNIAGKRFFNFFDFFFLFFTEFYCLGRVWTEFRPKIFFLPLSAYLILFRR